MLAVYSTHCVSVVVVRWSVDGGEAGAVIVQAVKLKGLSIVKGWSHYFSIISRVVMSGNEERVDSVILGVDIKHAAGGSADNADATVMDDEDDDDEDEGDADVSAGSAASVGLILPITNSMTVEITGQW